MLWRLQLVSVSCVWETGSESIGRLHSGFGFWIHALPFFSSAAAFCSSKKMQQRPLVNILQDFSMTNKKASFITLSSWFSRVLSNATYSSRSPTLGDPSIMKWKTKKDCYSYFILCVGQQTQKGQEKERKERNII